MTRHEREQNRAGVEFIIQFNKFVNFERMYIDNTLPFYFSLFVYGVLREQVCIKEIFLSMDVYREEYISNLKYT